MFVRKCIVVLAMGAAATGCVVDTEKEGEPLPEPTEQTGSAQSRLSSGLLFPGREQDVPSGAYWRASNNHYDMHMVRFDQGSNKWTRLRPGVASETSVNDHLIYGTPVYASNDGEVVTCWRNAPENPVDIPHPGRDGCNDADGDGNPCDQNETCSCTVPRSGNHVNVLSADGTIMLYAHLITDSVPSAICPNGNEFVGDAEEKDPTLGGANGHHPEMFVPVGSRATIQKGQFLGYVGHSGASSGPHLHQHMNDYATGTKIPIEYTGGQYQVYPGGSTNIDSDDWEALDGSTPLLVSSSESDKLILPPSGPERDYAYVWASQSNATHTAPGNYSRSSAGDLFGAGVTQTVTHLSTGRYRVVLPSIGSQWRGNVQVSAYGSDNRRCKVVGQSAFFFAALVLVDCYNAAGVRANSRFTTSFRRLGSPTGSPGEAYVTTSGLGSELVPIEDQHNSMGAPNSVQRVGEGRYTVRFPDQNPRPRGGTVQVTAVGDSSDYCKVSSWGTSGSAVTASIRCFDRFGGLNDSQFSVYYSATRAAGGLSGGYAWANNATSSEYSPSSNYEYTFKSGVGELAQSTTASRVSTGRYSIRFPAMSTTGSSALVTAYGTNSDYCKVQGWSASGNDTVVNVRCYNAAGSLVNTRFVASFANSDFSIL